MGDTENFDDREPPLPEEPVSSSQHRETEPAAHVTDSPDIDWTETPPPSAPLSQDRPQVRRSSLRPAPASFRPTARNPAQFRPAMVIHAGDAEPSGGKWEIPEPPPSQPSQIPLDSVARVEPFALAEDLTNDRAHEDDAESLKIPRAAALPREACQSPVAPAGIPNAPDTGVLAGGRRELTPESSQSRRPLVAVSIALILVGGIAAAMLGRRHEAAASGEPSVARVEQVPTPASALAHQERPQPTAPAATDTKPSEPIASANPTVPADAVPADAAPGTTRVTLEVKPPDAKVNQRGLAVPGPPYVFDVPKGKRITVEVARAGFVTRKVVIEDKKPLITLGLVRTAQTRQPR